jgi:hypothetical protein
LRLLSKLAQARLDADPALAALRAAAGGVGESAWAVDAGTYVNRETGRPYTPHHADEARFVASDTPRRVLVKGGEGGGKSVAGIIKGLERLRRGMNGIMGSPDFEHLKRSLWPEFSRWCPWQHVIPEQQYRSRAGWEPTKPFTLTFKTPAGGTATLLCGGFDEPGAWEGPNVSFAHFDEPRRHKTAAMLKVLDGRCRIPGRNGEPAQLWLTSTPRKHWMFEYFGPWESADQVDPLATFKADSAVIDLLTVDNAANLAPGYVEQRRQSLTESEARVLLEAAWEDIDDVDRFLPSMTLWDACREDLPPLDPREPMVLAADAGINNDTFGLVGITRHPDRHDHAAARLIRNWVPRGGQALDLGEIEREIRDIHANFNVICFVFDPYQMVYMAQRLESAMWCMPFNQGAQRLEADKTLLDLVTSRHFAHDGDADLRRHADNADRKVDTETRKIRIVKRQNGLKVDLLVAASMGTYVCLYELNI